MSRLSRQASKAESVDDETIEVKRESPTDDRLAEELSSTQVADIKDELDTVSRPSTPSLVRTHFKSSRSSSVSSHHSRTTSSVPVKKEEEIADTNGAATPANVRPTKKGRAAKNALPPRIAPLFNELPDVTSEATSSFTVIDTCIYQNKYLGYTEHALECDCNEEWDVATKRNLACGPDSDCINRVCKMECEDDCSCGAKCQNQRFKRRKYADVSVIKTDKKGHGLRTNQDLRPNDFIFEYIGDVIPEGTFRKRMVAYDQEGIKHFYFMSLSKGEFVDATKKGNLGRFCNHSCNPNCYVDKWVVGDKLRMGIFAERSIKAGEELVFNYNVDRYGANPQPCYCGESNCTGFIGGKTQTERGTKLSAATIEALGIEDEDFEAWDTFVAKKPKKRKTEEDDEDYVNKVEAKVLESDSVTKVMASLMQCKEKWIAVKLLQRIQQADSEEVRHRIIKLHGYQILNSQLSAWREDENVVLQILDILDKLPRLTRNKIVDAKIEETLGPLVDHSDERVASQAAHLLDAWSKLELAYRIPRKKREDASTPVKAERGFERRESNLHERRRSRSRSRSKSPPKGPSGASLPTGPRALQTRPSFRPPPPPFPRGPPPLPRGWFSAQDKSGRNYFYSASGKTTWARPTQPADEPPPPPPKEVKQEDVLKSIIEGIVTAKDKEKDSKADTPEDKPAPKVSKAEKWKSYDEDKKKKLYENTLFPHIAHVMNKYKHKIPRDDLKRFAKELAKKLVASDFKAGRVKDPTKIDEKQQKKVKEYCKQYFDKAAHKHKKSEEDRKARKAMKQDGGPPSASPSTAAQSPIAIAPDASMQKEDDDQSQDIEMSDNELEDEDQSPSASTQNSILKRKRNGEDMETDPPMSPAKKLQVDTPPPPPPPPPAPPLETPPDSATPADSMDIETDIHDDTNFKTQSMADVLAQAQQEDGDEEMDVEVDREVTTFEGQTNGKMENPLVDGQDVAEETRQ